MLAGLTDRHALAADRPAPVGHTRRQQLFVQSRQVRGFRHRHQTVAPIPAQLSFHATLFIAAGRVAILALISPVRAERDDPIGLDTLPSPQDLLYQRGHVVVAQGAKHAPKIVEGVFVRFEQCLLCGIGVRSMERVARPHAAHREDLQFARFAAQLGKCLEPIDLSFLAPVVALRHEHFPATESQLLFTQPHVSPHSGLTDRVLAMLLAQPCPDPMCRVPLLARRLPVGLQHPVDVIFHRTQFGRVTYRFPLLWRNRAGNRLAHHSPVHSILFRQSQDRLSRRVSAPDLFK